MDKTILPNTFQIKKRILTKNITPGKRFFDEPYVKEGDVEYLEINPGQSKLIAAMVKGCKQFGIHEDSKILYLGASHGYTPSHVSSMISSGWLFCVEFAPVVTRDLVFLCEERKNMIPILADANKPDEYKDRITEVDVVFQDIAQRNQVEIFLKNLQFLKKGGFGLLALKARSVDVVKNPKVIFKEVRKELEKHVTLVDYRELAPFQKDHAFFVVKN
ncbi:MAG: fibrillarin-like rRNA/tRNA 2'-O-methyltransferase [Candidatus Woesearchaeota archaeon]|nr:fibrillarin-like rRNA/tRNA 2'-O-methyltransferase [Candidatus Woesearchaeota archaeon]